MNDREYLVSHGSAGDFGRFRAAAPVECRRGDRVVVRSQLGLELGVVLCEASLRHARMLQRTFVGELLRRATAADEETAQRLRQRGQQLFADGRRLLDELALPLQLIDVELLFDGRRATLHHVRWGECDEQLFVRTLSQRHELIVALHDVGAPPAEVEPEDGGCGKPDCGQGHGGCTSCTTGGCATGCGSAAQAQEVRSYFANLRRQVDERQRTPLL